MTAKEFPNDTTIIQVGEPVEYISLISKGSVLLTLPSGKMTLKIGDAIGLHDICQGQHTCSYTTLECYIASISLLQSRGICLHFFVKTVNCLSFILIQ